MKEFTNIRELIGQIGLDLGVKAGVVSKSFRGNIRKELEKLSDKKNITVSIKQTSNGSLISLKIEDWVDKLEKATIIEEFKDLMDRIGATTGVCPGGAIPGNLVALLK
jgi:uncharacterized protein YacL (UPF0231 family)